MKLPQRTAHSSPHRTGSAKASPGCLKGFSKFLTLIRSSLLISYTLLLPFPCGRAWRAGVVIYIPVYFSEYGRQLSKSQNYGAFPIY